MPHRSRVSVADIPADIMCELIRNGEAYQPMLDGWRAAKGEAIREKQRAAEAGRIAGQKETAAVERIEEADRRDAKCAERETALVELDTNLRDRETTVETREQEQKAFADELSRREAAYQDGKARFVALARAVVDAP